MAPSGFSAIILASLILASLPLPWSEKGIVTVEAGESWVHPVGLELPAHVTCIVRSDRAVDVLLCGDDGLAALANGSQGPVSGRSDTGVTRCHWTEELPGSTHYLVVTNTGDEAAKVEYQVHVDFIVAGDLTAKNLMVLALALSMGVAALAIYGRRSWP